MVQTWILGTILGLNYVHMFGAMFWIVWHGLECGLDFVAGVCVRK